MAFLQMVLAGNGCCAGADAAERMCAARVADISWPAQPVVATSPLATAAAAPVRRVVTAQAPATIRENAQIIRSFAVART
jgi:hypothetical protein